MTTLPTSAFRDARMTNTSDCIFCKMAQGLMNVPKVYEDDDCICIRDIHPQAKTHLLVIPKEHLASLEEVFPVGGEPHHQLIGRLLEASVKIARQEGLLPGGFRTVMNTNANAGQTVYHLHVHLLGDEALKGTFGA